MADLSDRLQGMKDKVQDKAEDLKVDAKARMEQMRTENSEHSANEE